MDNHNKRLVTCAYRISNLPDHLIDSILERVPVQDAVRTSILSKKWRFRWTKMRALVFDEQFSTKFAKNGAFGRNGFIRIINQVLIFHEGPISKFHVHIPNITLDSFQEVDQWMLLLSRKGVQELFVINSKQQRYLLPSYVFSCLELGHLQLKNCMFKPPHELLNLKTLFLMKIDFGTNLHATSINLPQLRGLTLLKCTNVYNFNFEATNLKSLIVSSCHDVMLLPLLRSQCLIVVVIKFSNPVENFARIEKMNLATMLSHLPKIKNFFMDGYFLKFLAAEKIPKRLPHVVNSLMRLTLILNCGDLDELECALCMLRNSPKLEVLYVMVMVTDMNVDTEAASSYLESAECLEQTLNGLKTVEIRQVEGSRAELQFIKLLLDHSPCLEKMTIRPSTSVDTLKSFTIAKDVMRFPRASAKAKMIYLDPAPFFPRYPFRL